MKNLMLSIIFICLFNLIHSQDLKEIDSYSFEGTLNFIETLSNEFIATPFVELLHGSDYLVTVNCTYSFEVDQEGLLTVKRTCDNKEMYDHDLAWRAYLKRLTVSDLNCKEYDVDKSLNYVHLRCNQLRDFCFEKTKDNDISVNMNGMAIYVQTKTAAEKLHHAFEHLLELAYQNKSFITISEDK